jgi:glycosyltransferase involved in cell wall biosynthesis
MKRDPFHRYTYARVTRVLAISTVIRRNVLDTTPLTPDQVVTLHFPVDTERFHPEPERRRMMRRELGMAPESTVIGIVGRFSPGKGHEDLLAAVRELTASHRVTVLVVGEASFGEEAYEASIREMAGALGLEGVVTFLGFRRDVEAVLEACDVFAFPSHAEAFGMALIEAMAMGLPVVSTNCDGVLDIVVDGVTGLLVNPRMPAELAAGLRRLIDDPGLRLQMGSAGRARVLEHFDRRAHLDRIEQIYAELLTQARGDARGPADKP